jgi:hypothetical protein
LLYSVVQTRGQKKEEAFLEIVAPFCVSESRQIPVLL